LFENIIQSNIFEDIIKILINSDGETSLETKFEAIKALSFIAYCFKLKNANFDGELIYNHETIKNNLFHEECLQLLVSHTASDALEMRYQSLLCLSFLVEADSRALQTLLKLELVQMLLPCVGKPEGFIANYRLFE
jgi:hypothetical protein